MTFRIDDKGTTVSPDLGRMAVKGDPYPGVADEFEFVGYDPDKPAVEPVDDNIIAILKDIRGALRNPPKANPFWFQHIKTLPNIDNGEITIQTSEEFRHIWVAKAPRALNVYAGLGKSLFLISLAVGESMRASLPFAVNGVTIDWLTAGGAHQITVITSSEKLEVDRI
jgi:hypothetical protein